MSWWITVLPVENVLVEVALENSSPGGGRERE